MNRQSTRLYLSILFTLILCTGGAIYRFSHIDYLYSDEIFFHYLYTTEKLYFDGRYILIDVILSTLYRLGIPFYTFIVLNYICLISIVLMINNYFKSISITMLMAIIPITIVNFVYRDLILYALVLKCIGYIAESKINMKSFFLILLIGCLRPIYAIILIFLFFVLTQFKLLKAFILLSMIMVGPLIIELFQLYVLKGLEILDIYTIYAEARHHDPTLSAAIFGVLRQVAAPTPLALIWYSFPYREIPDLFYHSLRTVLHLFKLIIIMQCFAYFLLLITRIKTLWKSKIDYHTVIMCFSFVDILIYGALNFGEGHDRTKFFTVLFFMSFWFKYRGRMTLKWKNQ